MLSALKKSTLHSVALKKMAKYGVNWFFSALPQLGARIFTRDNVFPNLGKFGNNQFVKILSPSFGLIWPKFG
jgi:hypothetical protein